MREFKFRVWVDNKLIGPFQLQAISSLAAAYMSHDPKVIIEQFTGLKDKNGKEIYEGDTLRAFQKEQSDKEGKNGWEVTDTVYWQDGGFKVFGKCLQAGYTRNNNVLFQFMWCNTGHFNTPDHYYQLDDIEIIGNVHDVNPAVKDSVTDNMNINTDPAAKQPDELKQQATELESATQDQAMEVDSEEGAEAGEAEA